MRALDTNVLARFFVEDADDAQAAKQRPAAVAALAERAFVSVTVPTSNSSTSETLMVNACVVNEPSTLVARTTMPCEAAVSRSSSDPSATVTTPVVPLIVKRPPASSTSV